MTQPSESQTRSVAAIGDGCVIPGERERDPGSNGFADVPTKLDSRLRGNDDTCVIPGERERDPGSKWGIGCEGRNLGPGLRRDDDESPPR